MASLIDPNVPITGNPTTLSVRQNFATAKAEIEALQLGDIVTLTGDITGSGSGTVPTTLPIVNNNVGTFQGLQINAKGQVTGATNQSYLTTNQAITISGDATGTGTTAIPITLASTAVAPGSYTNTSLTVDQKGRITAASNGALGLTGITAGNGLTGGGTTGNVTISLTTPVSVPNGGLGVSSLTANALLVGTGTSPVHPSLIASDDGVSFKISSNIIVGSATGGASGAMGPGTLNVAGGYYVNGVAIGGTAVAVSDTPPATPAQGNQWWDSVGGQLYVYINDGTSSQWVAATNVPLAPNVILPLTANAVLVGNGSNPVVASAITSDNGTTLRVSTNQIIGTAVTGQANRSLIINQNVGNPPTTASALEIHGADAASPITLLATYGGPGAHYFRRYNGTAAAPTSMLLNQVIGSVNAQGKTPAAAANGGILSFTATENWTNAAQGTRVTFTTVATGGTALTDRMSVLQGVVIGNPAPDPGQGALILNANVAAPAAPAAGTLLQVTAADGQPSKITVNSLAAAPAYEMRYAGGTLAAPSAPPGAAFLGAINQFAWNGSSYAVAGQMAVISTEAWTGAANGSAVLFSTVANGTTALTERVRIDHNGNVGIGTTAPAFKLHVHHATDVNFMLFNNGGRSALAALNDANNAWNPIDINPSGNVYLSSASGGVGIGTTTPGNQLEVGNGAAATRTVAAVNGGASGTSAGGMFLLRNGGSSIMAFGNASAIAGSAYDATAMIWATGNFTMAPVGNLALTPGANVGIGTTGPQVKLDVRCVAAAGGVAGAFRSGPNGADSTSYMLAFSDFANSVVIGSIIRNGTNTVAYVTTSDQRLKDNITESRRGLDALLAIKVSDYKMGETASQGLLAQDVAKVYPEAVHEGGKDPNLQPWMIDYGRLTPLIIKAVQDLAAEVKALAPPPARKARAE